VLALTSLIRPFHYCNELRPYFTIHDSDFKSLTGPYSTHSTRHETRQTDKNNQTSQQTPARQAGLILGVTNPFFCKTLDKVLDICTRLVNICFFFQIPHILRLGDGTEKSSGKIKGISKLKALESKPGLYTNHKSIIDKDKKSLEGLCKNIQGKSSITSLLVD